MPSSSSRMHAYACLASHSSPVCLQTLRSSSLPSLGKIEERLMVPEQTVLNTWYLDSHRTVLNTWYLDSHRTDQFSCCIWGDSSISSHHAMLFSHPKNAIEAIFQLLLHSTAFFSCFDSHQQASCAVPWSVKHSGGRNRSPMPANTNIRSIPKCTKKRCKSQQRSARS